MPVKKGQELILKIDSLAYGGKGVSRVDDFVIFVKNAIPGQRVTARITKKRSSYLEAQSLEVLNKSPYEVEIQCEHFSDCGGCSFQNLDYNKQIEAKNRGYIHQKQ